MIIDDKVRSLVYAIEKNEGLSPADLKQHIEQLIITIFDNCQLPAVQQRYKDYFHNDFSSSDPAAQIGTYPIDADGYAVALDPLRDEQQIWDHWVQFGVTITANAIGSDLINAAVARISEIAAGLSNGKFNIDDPATHQYLPRDATGNTLISRGFMDVYQDDMLVQLRQAIRVWLHLVIIWGRPDLWTTYDRLGVKLAGHPESKGLPLHIDQNYNVDPGFVTVQGVLALSDCPAERGTLVTVPGSRAFFHKYGEIVATQRPGYRGEYVELDLRQDFAKILQQGYQVLPMRAGTFATWDSRTTHANSPNKSLLARKVAYVSAGPAKEYDQVALVARQQALESGVGVNNRRANLHATTKPRFADYTALQQIRQPALFSELGKFLHNLRHYHEILDSVQHPLKLHKKILLNAEGFGYGPVATIATLFPAIRANFSHVALLGNGHTLELQPDGYDVVYDSAELQKNNIAVKDILAQYDLFLTVSDFSMAQIAVQMRVPTIIVDQLAWFWGKIPSVLQQPEVLYLPQNFIGVEERLAENPSSYGLYRTVAPILAPVERTPDTVRDTVLINLGGLSNPHWNAEETLLFAQMICLAIRNALPAGTKVLIAANAKIAAQIGGKNYSRAEMRALLPTVKVAFMTSGLGNIYEAAAHNIPTIYLPAANDSQGRQAQLMQEQGFHDFAIDWSALGLEINYNAKQVVVMHEIAHAIQKVMQNPQLQNQLTALCAQTFSMALAQESSNATKLLYKFGRNGITHVLHATLSFARAPRAKRVSERTVMSLALYPDTQLLFRTDSEMLQFTIADFQALQAHLPGVRSAVLPQPARTLTLQHKQRYDEAATLEQHENGVDLTANFGSLIPEDVVHLLYGMARANWLRQNLCVVHAACVGIAPDTHVLIIGPAGSGKTSTALNCILGSEASQKFTLFSGDKTIIELGADGVMRARAGTKNMTLRVADRARWPQITKGEYRNDRFVFKMQDDQYSADTVTIKAIFIVKLGDHDKCARVAHASSVHTLYPLFVDTERADIQFGVDQAMFDGAIPLANKQIINKRLSACLQNVQTFHLTGSLAQVTRHINNTLQPKPALLTSYLATTATALAKPAVVEETKTFLFGICGLGHGHIFRQLPLIEALLHAGHKVVIFGYGNSFEYFQRKFAQRCTVLEVHDRFIIGNAQGLDFAASAAAASAVNSASINFSAMAAAEKLGPYTLVISDYEEVAAEYARMRNIPLVTIDQQSKYLLGGFPQDLSGTNYIDEVQRLRAFFHDAYARIAFSFFDVKVTDDTYKVKIMPPILRPEVLGLRNKPLCKQTTILVYMSALYTLHLDAVATILQQFPETRFEVFLPEKLNTLPDTFNVKFHNSDTPEFFPILAGCHGIIATAGHSLLSEAMYLYKPVLAIPAQMYEQQMNAKVIQDHRFGLSCAEGALNTIVVREFLQNLKSFAENIRRNEAGMLLGASDSVTIKDLVLQLAKDANDHKDAATQKARVALMPR